MNSKEVKDYLNQIRLLDRIVQNRKRQKERWLEIAKNISASYENERVQSSGSQQRMADAVVASIDFGNEMDAAIIQREAEKQHIISQLEKLKPDEYDVLYGLYVDFKSPDDVAEDCGKSRSWVTSMHGQALVSLGKILDSERNCAKL